MNEMKTAFDGVRAGVRDALTPRLEGLVEAIMDKFFPRLLHIFMTEAQATHMMWLTIADISADRVRAYRYEEDTEDEEKKDDGCPKADN